MSSENNYSAKNIRVLKGLEAVRKRPGMYIGDTNRAGLHHLIYEIVDNSVDEALAGYCNDIKIIFHEEDNSVEIIDNGRGVPTDIHPEEGISAATIVFTTLHAGGKFDGEEDSYKVSGGLHGVGASVTNALSTYLDLTINKNDHVYYQRFEKGTPVDVLKEVRPMVAGEKNGTTVRFSPDEEIFPEALEEVNGINLDPSYIVERIKRTSYLTKGLKLTIIDGKGVEKVFYSENGIIDLVKDTVPDLVKEDGLTYEEDESVMLTDIVYFDGADTDSEADIAFTYVNKFYGSKVASFANNIFTEQGGTHVLGFEKALLKVINDYAAKNMGLEQPLLKEDVLEGINAVISFRTKFPKFSDQTKKKLSTGLGHKLVYALVKEKLETLFEEKSDVANVIAQKCINSKKLREKMDKERNKERKSLVVSKFGGLPGKLADCTSKNPLESELFLVEGDSAGGSAKQGRDRKFQAILPLKGKILNTSKSDEEKMEKSTEVRSLISVLKTDYGDNYNHAKLRYDKIILMTDADVDGAHIAVLLLTFFMNKMPELVKQGHIYLAMPPLYVLKRRGGKGSHTYILDDAELNEKYPNGIPSGYEPLGRFKGLGEMNPDQLWETTMNPETRTLIRVQYKEEYKDDIAKVFEDLMGKDVDRRREFIMENALKANIDI